MMEKKKNKKKKRKETTFDISISYKARAKLDHISENVMWNNTHLHGFELNLINFGVFTYSRSLSVRRSDLFVVDGSRLLIENQSSRHKPRHDKGHKCLPCVTCRYGVLFHSLPPYLAQIVYASEGLDEETRHFGNFLVVFFKCFLSSFLEKSFV